MRGINTEYTEEGKNVRNAKRKKKSRRDIWKISFSLLSDLFPTFFVAPVIVFRKLSDVISFQLASYINAGKEPSQTARRQMAMCVDARKWEQPFAVIFFYPTHGIMFIL